MEAASCGDSPISWRQKQPGVPLPPTPSQLGLQEKPTCAPQVRKPWKKILQPQIRALPEVSDTQAKLKEVGPGPP
jgi:hypothetical protein